MVKQALFALAGFLLLFSCNKKDDFDDVNQEVNTSIVLTRKKNPQANPPEQPLPRHEIDQRVKQLIADSGRFEWHWLNLHELTSALQHSEQILSIGYAPSGLTVNAQNIHTFNMESAPWKNVRKALRQLIIEELNREGKNVSWNEILLEEDKNLPILTIRTNSSHVVTMLSNLENVRYLEPLGYWPQEVYRSSSGCAGSSYPPLAADYTTTSPNCKVPWNYYNVEIPQAWQYSQGAGITIGVIDAGISSTQYLLSSQFTNGLSASRTVTTGYTFGGTPFSSCTHGTSMSGLAAGPRNNLNATTGVAYRANLHFIRACEDVVLNTSDEQLGVKNAFVAMGNHSSVKIISISLGTPLKSNVIEDGVNYAYGKGKLIFAAAGTSFSITSWWGVIYPAAYTNCVAITGVKENGKSCSNCHDGQSVQYTIPIERDANDDRNTLSLANSGTNPSYVGGSSSATAITAGIAALVWSAKPTMTREQVLAVLSVTSQRFPNRHSSLGYGNLNAQKAVLYVVPR